MFVQKIFSIFLFCSLQVTTADDDICAFVPEPTQASLSCPVGEIISGFSFATFGTYSSTSSCAAGLVPEATCPVSVLAQATRLCSGSNSCNISCDCDTLPNPCGCSSSTPSLDGTTLLRLAFPGVPCSGVPKQLGLIASCIPALPPGPAQQPAPPTLAPTQLQLEFMPSPVLGLDNLQPHFSWTPPSSTSSARLSPSDVQIAARVIVSTFPENAVVWDSGSVQQTSPLLIPATPLPLLSDTRYQWTVSILNGQGVWSPGSDSARFNTGLLNPSDWNNASWIGGWRAGTLLRKDFTVVAGSPSFISVFASACQYYLLFIDGNRIGERELDVAWTRFNLFRSYSTYELDPSILGPGPHTVGLALGQGFCGQSLGKAGNHSTQGLLRLAIHNADGSLLQPAIVTDDTWTSGSGPVLTDSTYYGEQYNASMEQPGWSTFGFVPPSSAPLWTPAVIINDPPIPPTLSSQLMPPIQRVNFLTPVSITAVDAPGLQRYTFDFAQQVAGRAKLLVPSGVPKGTNFTMKHTEVMSHPPFATYDGSSWMGNLFWAYPVDSYISNGNGNESYEPSFTEHGFRYVELSIDPPLETPPTLATLTAVVLRTAARKQSTLELGNQILQLLSNASWWTEAAALMSIPAGAAARGERTGWSGDAAFASESELFDFDTGAFFSQFLVQIQQLQCTDGSIGSCIPNTDPERDGPPKPLPCTGQSGDPSWSTFYPTIVYGVWKYYGALGVARRHYDTVKLYMNMLESDVNTTSLGRIFCTWGDWNPVVKTDCHITAAASYLHDLQRMEELATALGETDDANYFAARLLSRRAEFHSAFFNTSIGLYDTGTQVAQAVALWTGVASQANMNLNISSYLGQAMSSTSGLTFGFIGVRYAFEALALNNQIESALRCLLSTTYPSYGFELFNLYEPSSSLWESWDAPTHRQWLDESSRNHHYQASIHTFLRKFVVGLDMPKGASAWSTVIVKPYAALPLPSDLATAIPYARITTNSYRGSIVVSWQRVNLPDRKLFLNVLLPAGSQGIVSFPKVPNATSYFESGNVIWDSSGFHPQAGILDGVDDGDYYTFNTTSGNFTFAA
jgi:alpha-L-rhamnosidase